VAEKEKTLDPKDLKRVASSKNQVDICDATNNKQCQILLGGRRLFYTWMGSPNFYN
jgi:hypothetical protein